MSTVVPQPLPDARRQRSRRTRLELAGGRGKSLSIMLVLLGLSLVCALAGRAYSKGGHVRITSNVRRAMIQIDGNQMVPADATGAAEFAGIPFGSRSVQIIPQGFPAEYQPLTTTIHEAWLSGNNFSFTLQPVPVDLRVQTVPGAQISLNGQSSGYANNQGIFQKQGLNPGEYDITVSAPGYNPFQARQRLRPPAHQVYAYLSMTAERQRQIQQEQRAAQEKAQRFELLLRNAHQQFVTRHYPGALATVDQALQLQPGDARAQQLKNQIVQTMRILR
jgi:PEGA domain